jgi:hypothetical protein
LANAAAMLGMVARSISQIMGPAAGIRERNVARQTMSDPPGLSWM